MSIQISSETWSECILSLSGAERQYGYSHYALHTAALTAGEGGLAGQVGYLFLLLLTFV
jgi:hypothetical protein